MKTIILLIFILMISCELSSQGKIFDSNNIIRIDIVADLRTLFKDVNPDNAKYHSGFISYIDSKGKSVRLNVMLKTRGIFRRSPGNCNLPPLIVKFTDEDVDSTMFAETNKLKLVNSCNRKRESFQQFIVKEYMIYRMYSIFTHYSFRVRLLSIVYIDINNALPPFESLGFFIEDLDGVTKRTNTKSLKTQGIIQEAVDRSKMDVTAVFQFMIGNTDWSVPKLHNIKLVVSNLNLIPVAIPYDFDFCGFVTPPYTKPPEIIPIRNVTDRYYRGFCRTLKELEPTLKLFELKRGEVYSMLESDTLLSSKHKKNAIEYIDEFYNIIDNQKYIRREFIDNCRKE